MDGSAKRKIILLQRFTYFEHFLSKYIYLFHFRLPIYSVSADVSTEIWPQRTWVSLTKASICTSAKDPWTFPDLSTSIASINAHRVCYTRRPGNGKLLCPNQIKQNMWATGRLWQHLWEIRTSCHVGNQRWTTACGPNMSKQKACWPEVTIEKLLWTTCAESGVEQSLTRGIGKQYLNDVYKWYEQHSSEHLVFRKCIGQNARTMWMQQSRCEQHVGIFWQHVHITQTSCRHSQNIGTKRFPTDAGQRGENSNHHVTIFLQDVGNMRTRCNTTSGEEVDDMWARCRQGAKNTDKSDGWTRAVWRP
jgi:hypothetical protein